MDIGYAEKGRLVLLINLKLGGYRVETCAFSMADWHGDCGRRTRNEWVHTRAGESDWQIRRSRLQEIDAWRDVAYFEVGFPSLILGQHDSVRMPVHAVV